MQSSFSDPSLLVIFTYAIAGLGHLRVTDALYRGMPKGTNHIILDSRDPRLELFHRIVSINVLGRSILEYFQHGFSEDFSSNIYRWYLRTHTSEVYEQLRTLIAQFEHPPKTIVIVASHFSLVHQIAQIKEQLMKETKVRIVVVVQVTDDSPQHIWYVEGADLIVAPSAYTKKTLEEYGKKAGFKPVPIVVTPYPVSPTLAVTSDAVYQNRVDSLDPSSKIVCHIAIPISGAAIGLHYFLSLLPKLQSRSDRFRFHIVSRDAPYTRTFLSFMNDKPFAHLDVTRTDREVVDDYEKIYEDHPIALEITKPSEQAFKTLLSFRAIGGSVILFMAPVGRQERDNLSFMEHHKLIPTQVETDQLLNMVKKGLLTSDVIHSTVCPLLAGYRGLRIPDHPNDAALLIDTCFRAGVFKHMVTCTHRKELLIDKGNELGSDGVAQFWKNVDEYLLRT